MDTHGLSKRLEEIRRLLEHPDIDQPTREQLEALEIELEETLSLQAVGK